MRIHDIIILSLQASQHFFPLPIPDNLHNRPLVRLPCPHQIVEYAERHDCAGDQNCVIHRTGRRRRCGRPEAEEDDNDHVDACKGVDSNSPHPGDAPGAPCQLGVFINSGVGRWFGESFLRQADGAGAAAPEKKATTNQIGAVEAGDCE